MKIFILGLSIVCIIIMLALFITAIVVGNYWSELSEYHKKSRT